jgi:uncharacterized protein YndB with AHSA1/START domain
MAEAEQQVERQAGNRWILPLAGAAAGLAVGAIIGGGKLVRIYDWTTEWNIDAPRAEVFRILNSPDDQANWWPSMVVESAEPMPEMPEGQIVTIRVLQAPSVRRLAPPFILVTKTSAIEQDRRTRVVVTGDLAGVLDTLLYDRPDGGTRVVYHWYTRVTNPLMNFMGFFLAPMFRASHDHVMREGEEGLRAYCAALASQREAARSISATGATGE